MEDDDTEQINTEEELFWKAFPTFLALGMSPDDYWNGNPYYASAYIQAEEIKFERENNNRYQQGLYNHLAFSAVMADFGWNFGGRKGAKPSGYLEYPIAITINEKKAETKRNKEKTMKWVMQNQ